MVSGYWLVVCGQWQVQRAQHTWLSKDVDCAGLRLPGPYSGWRRSLPDVTAV
jgi:hypothetical protein